MFVDPDGSVTFSDFPAEVAEAAMELDPESAPTCALSRKRRT